MAGRRRAELSEGWREAPRRTGGIRQVERRESSEKDRRPWTRGALRPHGGGCGPPAGGTGGPGVCALGLRL